MFEVLLGKEMSFFVARFVMESAIMRALVFMYPPVKSHTNIFKNY